MNLSNSFQIRLLTIVYIFFLFSCKKKDEILPDISVSNPSTNSQYYALQDEIPCSGTVSDDVELDRIEYQLVTTTGSPVMPKEIDIPNSNPYSFNKGYELDDIHLNSGTYMMKIEVFDKAGNSKSIFREVIIFGVPRTKQGVFYVADNSGSFTLGRIDSLDQDSIPIATFPDYGGMEINNYDQQLFYMGYESVDLIAFNTRNYTYDWTIDNLANPPGTYYFHELNYSEDQYLMVSLFDDQVLKRYKDGSGTGNVVLNYSGGQPETTFKDGNFIYVESLTLGTGIRRFQRYFFNSGVYDEDYTAPFDFKKILKKSTNELLVLGNSGGQAQLRIFYTNGGNFFQPLNLLPGEFIDAFQIDDDNYLIIQDGGIYAYTYSSNNLITVISGSGILSADYDVVNDRIYVGIANAIRIYSASGVFLQNIPVSGDVINLKVHFNK